MKLSHLLAGALAACALTTLAHSQAAPVGAVVASDGNCPASAILLPGIGRMIYANSKGGLCVDTSGGPNSLGAQYNTTLPTYTNGQSTVLQTDMNGRLLVYLGGSTLFYDSPSGNPNSGLVADPGGAMSGGSLYNPATGCALYKTGTGSLFSYTGLIIVPTGHTYWMVVLDTNVVPANPSTLGQGSQTSPAIGWITAPIPITGTTSVSFTDHFFTFSGTGLAICITESALPTSFVVPTDAVTFFSVMVKHL